MVFLIRVIVWLPAIMGWYCMQAQTVIVIDTPTASAIDPGLWVSNANYVDKIPERRIRKGVFRNHNLTFQLQTDSLLIVSSAAWLGTNALYLIEAGDSIHVKHETETIRFTGKGADKFRLVQQVDSVSAAFRKHLKYKQIGSVKDYLEFSTLVDTQVAAVLAVMKNFEHSVKRSLFDRIKANTLAGLEFERVNIFYVLAANAQRVNLSKEDLVAIMDSTVDNQNSRWLRSLALIMDDLDYYYLYTNLDVLVRTYGFDLQAEAINSTAKRRKAYYQYTKEHFRGMVKERLLAYILVHQTINNIGFTEETEEMLADYYSRPDHPEFKNSVRAAEARSRVLKAGRPAPNFSLIDLHGNTWSKKDLNGKIALVHFITTNTLSDFRKVTGMLPGDTGVVIVNIAKDRAALANYSKLSEHPKYKTINVCAQSEKDYQSLYKRYAVGLSDGWYLLDAYGNIVEGVLKNPFFDNGQQVSRLIKNQLVTLHDGPYVCYDEGGTTVYTFLGNTFTKQDYPNKNERPVLRVQSDEWRRSFEVPLRMQINNEPCLFEEPARLLVISDIEGNFGAFKNLLLQGRVIDENFNWTFGNGHLVLVGDFFDRGQQVTECLWLIYALEQKAQAKGGYVHFILGNHEIMNLSGKDRYVQAKYRDNATRVKRKYKDFYNEHTELGRWLLSKNIVEKIGDLLFVHGGICKEVADLSSSLSEINSLARPWYLKDSLLATAGADINLLFSSRTSPFWYRQYYQDEEMKVYSSGDTAWRPTKDEIDYILSRYNVRRIVTGHTIVSDTISQHYDGKIINTDTKHAAGKSEALLIDKRSFYRINSAGKMTLLLKE